MGFPIFGSTGMTHWDQEKAFPGVTVYTTFGSDHAKLIDLDGTVVHTWHPRRRCNPTTSSCGPTATCLCAGRTSRLVEVTTEGEIVREYMNPETFPWRGDQRNRTIFRAYRYAVNGPEIQGRV